MLLLKEILKEALEKHPAVEVLEVMDEVIEEKAREQLTKEIYQQIFNPNQVISEKAKRKEMMRGA